MTKFTTSSRARPGTMGRCGGSLAAAIVDLVGAAWHNLAEDSLGVTPLHRPLALTILQRMADAGLVSLIHHANDSTADQITVAADQVLHASVTAMAVAVVFVVFMATVIAATALLPALVAATAMTALILPGIRRH